MSDPTKRLKSLMGGEMPFKAAEANAERPQATGLPLQDARPSDTADPPFRAPVAQMMPIRLATAPNRPIVKLPSLPDPRRPLTTATPSPAIKSKELEKQNWCNSLRRAQRYLGLRGSAQAHALDVRNHQLVKYAFDFDPILIAIDVEANESNHDLVTEIGVAILDTRSLAPVAPGVCGSNWQDLVKGKHFRISERAHVRNHLYVQGDPSGFLPRFGTSEFVSLRDAADKVRDCFSQLDSSHLSPVLRNVVLIGHDIKGDIRWLESLGLNLLDISNLLEVLTTDDLQRAMKRDGNGATSLARLLAETDIPAQGLHNAGNDAAFTLQAFIALTLRSLSPWRPVHSLENRMSEAVMVAKASVLSEWKAWGLAEMRARNGNEPVPFRFSKLRG